MCCEKIYIVLKLCIFNMENFGRAIEMLREGKKVSRYGWNGKGQHLELQTPDENSKMTLPYIFIKTVQEDLVPWMASQTDMLAEDWFECSDEEKAE